MLKADAEIPVNDEVTLKRFAHDVDGIKFKTIQSNRDHLLPWLPWVDNIYFPTQVRLFTENQIKEFNHGRIFGYNVFFNKVFVGSAVIYDVSERNHNCKLGYWLDKLYRGRGIATQCATTLIDYAFNSLNMHRIEIRAAVGNEASIALAKRLNFTKEAILHDEQYLIDRYYDSIIYAKIR